MMMWLLFLLYIARTEPVISQVSPIGENRLVLKGDRPCEGHIEIYRNGEPGYVGHTYWDDKIEKVVCRSAHCGEPKAPAETIFRPDDKRVWLDDISCHGNESHLSECSFPGWDVLPGRVETVKKITCSDEVKISLDGQSCAGAVMYSINKKEGYFCADRWGLNESNVVCETLGCGSAMEASLERHWIDFPAAPKKMLDCSGIVDYKNLWQCVTNVPSQCKNPVSVKCADHKRLQLKKKAGTSNACTGYLEKEENGSWISFTNASYDEAACRQMHCGGSHNYSRDGTGLLLRCKDSVSVVLMDNSKPSRCYGAVHVKVNNDPDPDPVCASAWTIQDAQVVCSELNCGNVVISSSRGRREGGIMDNVKCSGTESSLWHCEAKHNQDSGFQCSNTAHVACSESVNMRLMDGPGECAGRVEIHYEGKWWRVREQAEWTSTNSETVCKQLNCGKVRSTSDRFSQGSGEFLPKTVECKQGAKNISECTMKESSGRGGGGFGGFGGFGGNEAKAVSITCEEHKVVFLEGTCSGKVGIAHGDKSYWLSGNNSNWNNQTAKTVCRQMHCGEALESNFVSNDNSNDIWKNVYNCSSDSESLFRCKAAKLPSDHNETAVATVKCSESLTVKLAEGCWGKVNVCMGGRCGGVCQDSWTDEKSKMLCKELGCGDTILRAYGKPGKTEVIFKSLHTTKHTKSLTQCNFVKNNKTDCEAAYVVCSGSARSKFDDFNSRFDCSGNVEVRYEGQFLPVCLNALTKETQNTICEELKCGQAVTTLPYFGLKSGKAPVISEIQCPENAKSVTACNIIRKEDSCTLGGLQCSKWRKVELNLGKKPCSGGVFVESKEGRMAVPADSLIKLANETGRTLCKDLNCGDFIKFHENSGLYPFWNRTFNCQDREKPENIWKCEKAHQLSPKLQLSVECQDPNVTLSGECHGEVRINNTHLCSSNWNDNYSNKLCKEKSCGSIALFHETGNQKTEMYHVSYDQCDRLGECNRYKEKCDKGTLSVYCVRNVKFNTTENCGGHIEVIYQDKREKVCAFPQEFQDELCNTLGCGGFNSALTRHIMSKKRREQVNLQKTVQCNAAFMDYKYCVKSGPCQGQAEIYCKDYVYKPDTGPSSSSPPTVAIIVGIALVLVLVILIAVFVRVYIVRRARRAKMAMNASSRMYSRQEVEFESGDYEDVSNKANEIEDFSRGNFRPDAEVFMESDARSNTSLPYDDIDEAVETRPLTSPAATKAGVSVDSYFQDGTLDQSTDGVTYEVDDPQESYDDIEAGPEVTETKAEVHTSPETTPEGVPAAPPGRVQGDEDYLVPGQDGLCKNA